MARGRSGGASIITTATVSVNARADADDLQGFNGTPRCQQHPLEQRDPAKRVSALFNVVGAGLEIDVGGTGC